MNDGAFVGEFASADATQEEIMRAIMRNKAFKRDGDARIGEMRP
jgi:putative multiple sugar transport system ATP-binding protein